MRGLQVNNMRSSRWVSASTVLVALATLSMPNLAMAGHLEEMSIDTFGNATRVQIDVAGDVDYHDFTLRNPDRLVIDFKGASSSLPSVLPQQALSGIVRGAEVMRWEPQDADPVTRVVLELDGRASYSIARHHDSVTVALESGAPTASDLGYDEDHLATVVPVEQTYEQAQSAYRDYASANHGSTAYAAPNASVIAEERGPSSDSTQRSFSPRVYGGARLEDSPNANRFANARRVSLDVQKASLMTVVRTLGELSGRNIVTNTEVTGDVTLRLSEVPWPQALDIVLLTQGLGYTDEEGVIRIASLEALRKEEVDREEAARKRDELMPLRTEVVPVNFAKAGELQPSIQKMLTQRGHAQVDERTNSLIVTDIAEKVSVAGALITRLDTRTPQVEIDARLVDVDVSDATDFGVDWTYNLTAAGAGEDLNFPQTFTSRNPIANPAGELRTGVLRSNWSLDAAIQALVSDRKANIISNPRITTVSNREASILVGQEIPLIVQDEAFNTVVQLKQIGIKLTVRPHITADNQIELDVHPEVSDLASQATVQGGIIINTSEADTRVLVGNGETAVIGGLIRENETETERGVPLLKDIPALGWIFKSQSLVKQKRELLIFITPRIVRNTAAQ